MAVVVEQGHLAAQPMKGLGQFTADGATPQYRQPPWQIGEGKHRFIG